jgi:hypothetical protein
MYNRIQFFLKKLIYPYLTSSHVSYNNLTWLMTLMIYCICILTYTRFTIQKNSTAIQFQQNFSKPDLKFYSVLIPLKFYPREWVDIGVTWHVCFENKMFFTYKEVVGETCT